jgi:hypothetical protein
MHYPSPCVPGCVVKYHGPSWIATIRRSTDRQDAFSASVPFNEGPDAAVQAAVDKINRKMGFDWVVLSFPQSIDDGTTYSYPVGPAGMRIYYHQHPIS